MSVDRSQVEAMARLAQLSVDEREADRLAQEMSRILEYADRLRTVRGAEDSVDAGGAGQPSDIVGTHVTGSDVIGTDVCGTDVTATGAPPTASDPLHRSPDEFAPRFEDGFFVVPPPPGVTPDG